MTFELYSDIYGSWRWRLTGADGCLLATADEAYVCKKDCEERVRRIRGSASVSVVEPNVWLEPSVPVGRLGAFGVAVRCLSRSSFRLL